MLSFWQNTKGRAYFLQLVLLLSIAALFWWLIGNTLDNLAERNITTGFGFLDKETGFEVNFSLLAYDETSSFSRLLFVGLANTALVSVIGIFFATLLGFTIGVMRLSSNWLVAKTATVYVEVLRNLPLLVQILFWYSAMLNLLPHPRQSYALAEVVFLNKRGLYLPGFEALPSFTLALSVFVLGMVIYFFMARRDKAKRVATGQKRLSRYFVIVGLVFAMFIVVGVYGIPFAFEYPQLKGFNFKGGISLTPEFVALALALITYTAAFIAEIVRSGIQAVSKGQVEAAQSLGLTRLQSLRMVVIPQAMRVIIPPLTSQYLNLTKNSSLAAAIAYPELVSVFAGTALNQTGQAIEILFITMSIYLGLSLLAAALMNWYNARVKLVER
ncbi:MAG: amino acid ABC transporter permease [Parvibaculales bacterium]